MYISKLGIVERSRCLFVVQKLSALSTSLARVVSTAEEEEAEIDKFPVEEVRKIAPLSSCVLSALN